ncbi:MAG TPA: hypothetical protein VNU72_04870 [Puia sp.]|nr:hypothetical protein [Puia sp.]
MGPRSYFVLLLVIGGVGLRAQAPAADSVPQKDLVDFFVKLFHIKLSDSTRNKKSIIFSLVPAAPVNLGQKQAVVSSLNMAFYAGNHATTNLSSIYFVPYTNFSDRSGFIVTPNVWLSNNEWNLIGDLRLSANQNYTYGVGGNTTEDTRDEVDNNYIRGYLTVNRKIWGPVYAGVGYNYDYYYNIKDTYTNDSPSVFSKYGIGTGPSSTSSGVTFNLLLDDRKNSLNPARGLYSSVVLRFNPSFLPNDNSWSSLYFDTRKYFSLSELKHSILGFWLLYWGCYGDVPYFNLPGTGLDASGRTGRGYVLGRYRGKQMIYGETEYRFDISRNGLWGGVVFANVQDYKELSSGEFAYLLPAAGTGLRIKFNKRSGVNLTLDFAVGKNSFNWYLNLGEFF